MTDCASSFFHIRRLPKSFQYIDYPPGDNNFEFFSALEPYFHVVERIFSFLDNRELRKCCLVNKSWKELAERTLAKRSYVTWFTYYRTKIAPRQLQFKICDKFWYNNVSCVIILFDNRRIIGPKGSKNKVWTEVWTYLRKEIIPPGREYYAINCPSVVSHFSSEVKDVRDHGLPSVMDGLLIPKIPNIKTVLLQCDVTTEDIENIHKHIEPDDEVKCLLVFMTRNLKQYVPVLLYRLVPEERVIAVGGGIVRGTNTIQQSNNCSDGHTSSNNIFCIAFLKNKHLDADFDAYSIVIQANHLIETQLEEKLLEFRSQITIRKEAFGVRICCTAKMNQEKESRIFSKLFPGIPVLGFTALGEFGWNCFGASVKCESGIEAKRRKYANIDLAYHEWSTVFVLITWGLKRSF